MTVGQMCVVFFWLVVAYNFGWRQGAKSAHSFYDDVFTEVSKDDEGIRGKLTIAVCRILHTQKMKSKKRHKVL